MAEKDLSEFSLLEYNDVHADVLNAYGFHADVVDPADLSPLDPRLVVADGMHLHGLVRDSAKVWVNRRQKLINAKYGQEHPIYYTHIENMSRSDHLMIVREKSYDGAGYHKQLLNVLSCEKELHKMRAEAAGKPVVIPPTMRQGLLTHPQLKLVLNFSFHRWRSNCEMSKIDNYEQELALLNEGGLAMCSDESMVVANVAFTTKEQLDLMKSDFRYLAELLVKLRTGEPYDFREAEVIHLNELMQAFAVFTGDPEWLTYQVAKKTDGGDKKVYNVREVIANREAGKTIFEIVLQQKNQNGYSTEEAMDKLFLSAKQRALYYQVSGEQAP